MTTIKDLEIENNRMFTKLPEGRNEKSQMTKGEFNAFDPELFTAVSRGFREDWLEANGYEITRANILDASLKPKQVKE